MDKYIYKSIKEYITSLGYWGFLVLGGIIFALLGLAQAFQIENVNPNIYLIILICILIIAPFFTFYTKNIQYHKIADVGIELIYGENTYCRQDDRRIKLKYENENGSLNKERSVYVTLTNIRIGVRSISQKEVENVEISLLAIDGKTLKLDDRRLNPSGSGINSAGSFLLPASEEPVKYVDLLSSHSDDDFFQLHYYRNIHETSKERMQPNTIPKANHKLRLIATGKDVASQNYIFDINVTKTGEIKCSLEKDMSATKIK